MSTAVAPRGDPIGLAAVSMGGSVAPRLPGDTVAPWGCLQSGELAGGLRPALQGMLSLGVEVSDGPLEFLRTAQEALV